MLEKLKQQLALFFDRFKFVSSALIGLALGVCLALPLFWIGVKSGAGRLRQAAFHSFEPVLKRQQDMSDECLRLEERLKAAGAKVSRKDFVKVELLRSRLAGAGDFDDQIELTQELERALVNVGTQYRQMMDPDKGDKKARASAYVREFGINWGPLMRYLVDEEYHFTSAVKSYNSILLIPPVPFIISHRNFAALVGSLIGELKHRVIAYLKQGLAWCRYGLQLLWSKIRHKDAPQLPQPMEDAPRPSEALYTALPVPYYIAQAPVPEEDYHELQYNRDQPDMADVEVGQEKAVLESGRREPFAAPLPTVQKTVTY